MKHNTPSAEQGQRHARQSAAVEPPKPRRRRWTQFSIRALLLLMLLAACGTWWYSTERKKAARQERAVAALNKLAERGSVWLIYPYNIDQQGQYDPGAPAPHDYPWKRALFGDAYVDKPKTLRISLDDELTTAELAPIAELPTLEGIAVVVQQREPGCLAAIGRLPEAQRINIAYGQLSDADVSTWGALSQLQSVALRVDQGTLTREAVTELFRNKRQLNQVLFTNLTFGAGAFREFDPLPSLSSFICENCAFADQDFSALERAPLKTLGLVNCNVTDAGMSHFRGMTSLESLNLTGAPITDAGIASLSAMTALKRLQLTEVPITDAGLTHLANLQALEDLQLTGVAVNGSGFAQLVNLPVLNSLMLDKCDLSAEGFSHVGRFGHLLGLGLADCELTGTSLAGLAESKSLQILSVRNCRLKDGAFESLARIPNLKQLMVDSSDFRNEELAGLRFASTLDFLDLSNAKVTDSGIAAMTGCHVKTLYLPPTVTPAAIPSLLQMKSLRRLQVNANFTPADVSALDAGLPGCFIHDAAASFSYMGGGGGTPPSAADPATSAEQQSSGSQ